MKTFFILIVVIFTSKLQTQIPIDTYKKEIKKMNNQEAIQEYWNGLLKLDQNVLLKTKNTEESDSISISNMIKTALMFEIHGKESYGMYNSVPIMNLSHNSIGKANVAFWSIIEQCAEVGGVIEEIGGKFPAYELESIALSFYGYSLFGQDSLYPQLREKLIKSTQKELLSTYLVSVFEELKQTRTLVRKQTLGKWKEKPFKNLEDEQCFEFVEMSDRNIYVLRNEHFNKLEQISYEGNYTTYHIENEPFGWYYEYYKNGNLKLCNEEGNELISYNSCNK